jgi:hypothetical protein
MTGCATNGGKLGEANTLHAGDVVQVLTRAEIIAHQGLLETLSKSGVTDSEITDGRVVVVRNMCCGPPNTNNPHGALNPHGLNIHVGDVVEFFWPGGSAVNSVTRILQPAGQDDGACWWDPKDERLWRRVMYCTWMPEQGWMKQEGLGTIGWYKQTEHM